MHSSTLIGKTIPYQVSPVERITYAGGVHIKPKFVDAVALFSEDHFTGIDLNFCIYNEGYGADWGGVPGWTAPPKPCGNLIDVIV